MQTAPLSLADRLVDADATVRRLAVIDLPYSDEEDIVPLLLPRLTDTDPQVRTEAIRALEGFEQPEVVQALAPMLTQMSARPPARCWPS